MTVSKNSRMLNLLNWRMKITLKDGRVLTGQMLAFDRHMNLVVGDCEETRSIKNSGSHKKGKSSNAGTSTAAGTAKEEKRVLGLVILRGEHVVSIISIAPPTSGAGGPKRASGAQQMLMPFPPGMGRPAGRGMPVAAAGSAPMGLAGPVGGVGGPMPPAHMQRPPMGMMPPMGMSMPPPGFRPPGPGMSMPPGMQPPMGMSMPPGFRPPPQGMVPPGFRPPFRPPPSQ
eukprot:Partr_v1_DN25785_c1_g1_i1_m74851 putative small nuclear ribonucleoprotein-associated protein